MNKRYPIIPKPYNLKPLDGYFILSPDTAIITNDSEAWNAGYLSNLLTRATGYEIPIITGKSSSKSGIHLQIDDDIGEFGEEGYRLNVDKNKVIIYANNSKGIFYGIQSLRQLLPVEIEVLHKIPGIQWKIPCCQILDKPRFEWRGFMFDEGRHFHGFKNIIQIIDNLALLKLNILHWHLTEDQGWRIDIKQYPNLVQFGSKRSGTAQNLRSMLRGTHDNIPHSGFYTQDEIQKVVAYASKRNITIVPEIEMPGHSMAAIAAYPELSCKGGSFDVPTRFGIFSNIFCAGKDSTFEFLRNVLDEVFTLFPSTIIHIGGDEAPQSRWKKCPYCQHRIHEEILGDENELRGYFTNWIIKYLEANGRRAMGWSEIIHPGLPTNTIIQYWARNRTGLFKAIQNGNHVVNSAFLDTYLDHSYSITPLKRVYNFDPIFAGLDDNLAEYVIGLEAPLWTEWVPTKSRLDYQTYPRLTAFAETGWTPSLKKEYIGFKERLKIFNQRLDIFGVQYAPMGDWDPPWNKRLMRIFSIATPQTRIRE